MTTTPTLTGREEELALLSEELESAFQGSAPVILIEGDPGIGKSELLSAFIWAHANRRRLRVFTVRAAPEENYNPVEEVAYAATNKRLYTRLGGRRRALATARDLLPDWLGVIPGVGSAMAAVTATAKALHRRRNSGAAQPSLNEDIESLVGLARRRPLALLFDDLERADLDAVALLRELVFAAEGTQLLIVASYRPTAPGVADPPVHSLSSRLPSDRCTLVKLRPLSPASVERWLHGRFPGATIPANFQKWFVGATGGHPGTMHATVAHLLEASAIRQDANGWEFDTEAAPLDLPATGESFADLTGINPETAEIVQAASVLGNEFDALTLSRLLGRDELAVEDQLALGIHYGLLESLGETELPDGDLSTAYRFSAPHLRSALHRALPSEQRISLEEHLAAEAVRP